MEGVADALAARANIDLVDGAAIQHVQAGGILVDQRLLLKLLRQPQTRAPRSSELPGRLTRRELEVLGAVAQGWSIREVAERLSISAHTARAHLRNIMAKLG